MSSSTLPFRDRIIPWYFVMFFAVIVIVNVIMATLAVRTMSGIVTEHPYEKGLAYNQVIAAEEQQEALGWKQQVAYSNGKLHITLQDKNGHSLTPDSMVATITRPTQKGLDFSLPLTGTDTKVEFPAKGLWEVRVDSLVGAHHYQQSKRLVIE